jgi:FkbM family methyltransferase
VIRQTYRLAAEACAEILWRVPALERPFVRFGPRALATPGVRVFYRSAAHRLGKRFRSNDTHFRAVSVGDRQLVLDVTEFTAGPLYFGGAVYEPETTAYFMQHLKNGDVFVDVGANHGYFTVLAASLVGASGRVVAFEPNPRVFVQLRTHVDLNGFESRVTLESCALGDRTQREARLYVSQSATNSGLSSLTPSHDMLEIGDLSEERTVAVDVDTFDRWIARSDIHQIDLLKIDVEGAEALVVGGMAAALDSGRIQSLIVETTWDGAAHRLLCDAGYVARRLDPIGSLINILFVRRGDAHCG